MCALVLLLLLVLQASRLVCTNKLQTRPHVSSPPSLHIYYSHIPSLALHNYPNQTVAPHNTCGKRQPQKTGAQPDPQ